LNETYDFCDSVEYLSWERYYTDLLSKLCKDVYEITYAKKKLNSFFKTDFYMKEIQNKLTDLDKSVFKEIT
jgi:uncharacterized protein YutD